MTLVEQNVGSVGTFPTGNEVRGCSEFPLKIPTGIEAYLGPDFSDGNYNKIPPAKLNPPP